MSFSRLQFSGLCLLLLFNSAAAQQFEEISKWVPDSANALVMVCAGKSWDS